MSRFRPSLNTGADAPRAPLRESVAHSAPIGTLEPPAPAAAIPAVTILPAAPKASIAGIGGMVIALGVYAAMHAAPAAEILVAYVHVTVPLLGIFSVLITIAACFTGNATRFLEAPGSRAWLGFGAIMVLAAFLGNYPGRSVPFVLEYIGRLHIMPFLICAIALTPAQVRHVMTWAAAAQFLILFMCFRYGDLADGRFYVPEVASLANPNDLAFMLLFVGSFLMILIFRRALFGRIVWLFTFPLTLYYVFRTGSRANFLTLIVVAGFLFLTAPRRIKLVFLVLSPAIAILMLVAVPRDTWERLTLIVVNPERTYVQDGNLQGAVDSQAARQELQKRAVSLSLRHPLLGVGALMFADAVEEYVREEMHIKSGWQNPHNVYLQVAAENGIPAFLLFVWCVLLCIRTNYKAVKLCEKNMALRESQPQCFALLVASLVSAVGILFCNVLFAPVLSLLIGFTAANSLALRDQLARIALEQSALTA